MDPTNLTDDQLDALAQQLAGRLPTGTHGDRVVLSRRQFAAASAGVLSTGALMALGVDEASAQAAGQQGTATSPNDMFAYNLDVANGVTSALPMGGNDIANAGSVSADSATIGNGDTVTQVEFGVATLPGPPASSGTGWDTVESTTSAISFSSTFASAPNVVLGLNSPTPGLTTSADQRTTSGFRMILQNYDTQDHSSSSFEISWVAIV